MTQFEWLLREASIQEGCGSWTTTDEILREIDANPDWLKTYGMEEIKLRDRVICKLMGLEYKEPT